MGKTVGEKWPRETFEYGRARVTVERQTVRHALIFNRVLFMLPEASDAIERLFQTTFSRAAAQTVKMEGVDVTFPDSGAPAEKWLLAYDLFQRMDAGLFDAWLAALEAVDAPPNDNALLPSHRLNEEARKNAKSAGLLGNESSGANSKT